MSFRLRFMLVGVWTASFCSGLWADNVVVHILRSTTMTANVDNNGGYGVPDANPEGRFQFFINGVRQLGEGSLILTDGNDIYNGRADNDYSPPKNDVVKFDASGTYGFVGEYTAQADGTPVAFRSFDDRFLVRQSTYAKLNTSYVIYKWVVQNIGPTPAPTRLLFLTDWDLVDTEDDLDSDWDSARQLAYQTDFDSTNLSNLAAGVSLLEGSLHQYHLGNCCDFRETDAQLANYFTDVPGWIGDIDNGSLDKQVGVSADLGTLMPGQLACVAFVQALGSNITPVTALEDLQGQIDDAASLWSQLPASARCSALNPTINPGMNNAWVNANAPYQGHFLTVYPDAGLVFQAWFTFDTGVQAQLTARNEAAGQKKQSAATFGADDTRWVTAVGFFQGNKATLTAELTSGGVFNASQPLATQTPNYGTIDLEFVSCEEAIMTYDFPSVGVSGTDTLMRVVPGDTELCELLAEP